MIAGAPSPEVQFLRNTLQRDQHVEFAAWLQHADPGYRQAGDRPINRLPNDADELGKYDALVLIDPDMNALGPQWPDLIANFVGKDGGGLIFIPGELYSQALFEADAGDAGSTDPNPATDSGAGPGDQPAGGKWTKILPIVREPGLFRTESEVRLTTQNTYVLDLTPEGRGDPIFEFNPDPIRNRATLASLPGMYWSFPVTRARPGATVLARHGDPRMQNQYGRHVLLASQLYGPGRTVFIGFDSTYRWRYLSEDFFDGFWARLIDRVGRNKALGGRFPFQVHLGKSAYRVGDQVTVGVRYTEAAAVAEASGLAAELEIEGQPPDPLTFERSPEDPALLTATFPAERAGAYTMRITPATGVDAGAATRVSSTTFRVEPPRREVDEPALEPPLARRPRPPDRRPGLHGGRGRPARRGDPDPRGDADAGEPRRTLGRPPLLGDHRPRPDRRMDFAEALPDGLMDRPTARPDIARTSTVTTATLTDPSTAIGTLQEEQARLRRRLRQARGRLRIQMALEIRARRGRRGGPGRGAPGGARRLAPARADDAAGPALRRRGRGPARPGDRRWFPRFRAMRLDDLGLAMTLDRVRPGTGQQVADVLQLPDQLGDDRSTSPALIRLAVRRASDSLAAVDWRAHWNGRRTLGRALGLIAALAVPVGFAVALPDVARLSLARWLLGSTSGGRSGRTWPWPAWATATACSPRATSRSRSRSAPTPRATAAGGLWSLPGRGVPFTVRREPKHRVIPEDVRLRERAADGGVRDAVMTVVGAGIYRLELPPAATSSSFDLAGGDDWLGPIRVERVDRPSAGDDEAPGPRAGGVGRRISRRSRTPAST